MSDEHDDRLRELGTQLPWDRPDPARRDAVRSALLVAAAERDTRPSTRWYIVGGAFAAGALAAAAAVLLFVRSDERPTPISAARIDASPAAEVERKVTRTPTGVDEVVRVRSGSVSLSVGALRAGDHVRVATRDGEVEGEGRYQVVVAGDMLQAVTVAQGTATVRVTGQQAVFLSSGQSWQAKAVVAHGDLSESGGPAPAPVPDPVAAPAPVPDSATAPVPVPVPAAAPAPAAAAAPSAVSPAALASTPAREPTKPPRQSPATEPTARASVEPAPAPAVTAVDPAPQLAKTDVDPALAPKLTGPSEVERRFQAGMALLKANKPAEAARELVAAADAGGEDPLASDARYFAAVALTKAGRKTEAERTLVGFIDHAPKSIRRGRAAVMLARLIAERGDKPAARAWFESALDDADASVVAAARAGIAALK